MPENHNGLPVKGYRHQDSTAITRVNNHKTIEEEVLRMLDAMTGDPAFDQRWLAIGRTHLELGFMAVNRSVFKPGRIRLDGDEDAA